MLPCDRPEKPKKYYRIPALSKKRAAKIAAGEVKPGINRVSEKRAKEEAEYYNKTRPEFLKKNPICQCCKIAKSKEVHHKKGRIAKLLNNIKYFLAVCVACHRKIEANSEWAYQNKFSLSRTAKN